MVAVVRLLPRDRSSLVYIEPRDKAAQRRKLARGHPCCISRFVFPGRPPAPSGIFFPRPWPAHLSARSTRSPQRSAGYAYRCDRRLGSPHLHSEHIHAKRSPACDRVTAAYTCIPTSKWRSTRMYSGHRRAWNRATRRHYRALESRHEALQISAMQPDHPARRRDAGDFLVYGFASSIAVWRLLA